jgi:hypothetical protein
MGKRLVPVVSAVFAALLSWVVWITTVSYARAPGIVAALDRAGVLPFSPSELPIGLLCALLAVWEAVYFPITTLTSLE